MSIAGNQRISILLFKNIFKLTRTVLKKTHCKPSEPCFHYYWRYVAFTSYKIAAYLASSYPIETFIIHVIDLIKSILNAISIRKSRTNHH